MEAVREVWTDERMDDLNHRVDEGFRRMDREFQAIRLEMRTEFAAVRGEMKTEFAAVRGEMKTEFAALRSEMKIEFAATRAEMAAMNRTFMQIGAGAIVTIAIGFTGAIATQL
ncbi:MAG TPA: hypothetical protein VHU86_02835 [Solirubrobacterales bacterium]|jgi:hypothetical protein|nr:hypothetical protein [Solirubrobacterales bacterium]